MVCPCICVIRDQWISSPGRDDVRRRDHGVEPRYMDHRNRRSRSLPADREGFDVPIHILRVTEDAPLSGAVAAANPSILANRREEIRGFIRLPGCNCLVLLAILRVSTTKRTHSAVGTLSASFSLVYLRGPLWPCMA